MNLQRITLLIAFQAALVTGCGNLDASRYRAPSDSYGSVQASLDPLGTASSGLDKNFLCPSTANVVPDYDRDFDGSGFYRVCPSTISPYDVLIHGRTHASDTICVIPAEYIDATHVYLKPLVQGGQPQVSCLNAAQSAGAGVLATFPATRYNAVFIVESQYKDAMMACLPGGNYLFCPPYSFGKFR
jgi:hypothetical protein